MGPIPYIKQISTDRDGYVHKHYTVQAVDGYGNPIYLHEESTPVVLIWGAEGQRLISRIENATLNQVEEALGMNVKDFSSSDISATNLLK